MFVEFTEKFPESMSKFDCRLSINPKSVSSVSPINNGGTSISVMVGSAEDTIIAVQESYEEVVEKLTAEANK